MLSPKPKRIQELIRYFPGRSTWLYGNFHLVVGHLVGGKRLWAKTQAFFKILVFQEVGFFSNYFTLLAYHISHFSLMRKY